MRTLITSSAICLLVLTGCAGGEDPASDPTSQSAVTAPTDSETSLQTMTKFQLEIERVSGEIQCDERKITPASLGWGALFGCVSGKNETAKFFINEDVSTGNVASIKFLWNDWFKDAGYGIHADKDVAVAMLDSVLALYPSEHASALKSAFSSNENRTFRGESATFEYTFDRGPAIDEHMIVITPSGE